MKRIKIMTYNVCWEALDGVKTGIDMTRCNTSTGNRCMKGIARIINKRLKQKYDFICLQEINDRGWTSISPDLSLDDYSVIKKEIFPVGIIILYRNKHSPRLTYSGNLVSNGSERRLYIISLFSNNLVLITMHMPHHNQTQAIDLLKKRLSILKPYIDIDTTFIISGDLNNSRPLDIPSFRNLLDSFDKQINAEPREIKTCCVPNGQRYTVSFDHIFISTNAQYKKYSTIRKKEKYMSDHLPIFSEIIV